MEFGEYTKKSDKIIKRVKDYSYQERLKKIRINFFTR